MSEADIESFWKEHQNSLKQVRKKLGRHRPPKARIGSGASTRSVPNQVLRDAPRQKSILKTETAHFKQRRDPPNVRVHSGSSSRSTPSEIEHVSIRKSAFTPPSSYRRHTSNSHPPFGKYRNSPPSHLDRLNAPNSPVIKNGRKLRGNKFEVVPPVKPKKAFMRKVDYDSWGEDSGNESDDIQGRYLPNPHPVTFYHPPPTVVYGAPFPVFYPPPPKGAKGGKGKHRYRGQKKERGYKDMYRDRKSYKSKHKTKSRIPQSPLVRRQTVRVAREDDTPSDSSPTCITDISEDEKPHYQYIFAGHNTYDPYGEQMDKTAPMYLVKYPKFASDYIDWFIEDCLSEELVPDILIELYDELEKEAMYIGLPSMTPLRSERVPSLEEYYKPTLQVCEDFLGREIDKMIHEIVRECINNLADDYIMEKIEMKDPLEEWLNRLVEETITESCYDLVKQSTIELADDHLNAEYMNNILDDVITDVVLEAGPAIVDDSAFEILLDMFIENEVIKPEVEEESGEIAKEIIQSYDNKITKRELKAVTIQAEDKLAESLCLEYLLSTIARQGQLWSESDYASRDLDNMIVNTLIEQFMTVLHDRDKTLNNKPLKKLHQKVVTDVALDVLLQKLSASLDEDVADVDEYERGVVDGFYESL